MTLNNSEKNTNINNCTATELIHADNALYVWQQHNLLQAVEALAGRWAMSLNDGSDNDNHNSLTGLLNELTSTKISTDTRSIGAGDIFLALSGDNFDGHNYAQMAVEKGAVAIIVERVLADISVPQLIVSDSRLALGQLGAYRRRQHAKRVQATDNQLKVVAITGSSGKTTVKEMLGSIFSRIAPTLVTRGNLNNDLGVPMMLLELKDEHEFAILELGANHLGEIAYTAQLVQPDVACILNIGTAHLGEFGGRDKIAEAKAEIYQALALANVTNNDDVDNCDSHTNVNQLTGLNNLDDSSRRVTTAIVPDIDDYSELLRQTAQQYTDTVVGFGATDITVSDVLLHDFSSEFVVHLAENESSTKVILPLVGAHNVSNAMAVIACARAVGISMKDIVAGLQAVEPPKGRLYSKMLGKHRLIDDAYNANPHSVRASAQVLASQQGITVMVLGDIGELGDAAASEHYNLGADIAKMDIDYLFTLGEFAKTVVTGAQSVNNGTDSNGTDSNENCAARQTSQAFDDKQSLLAQLTQFVGQDKQPCSILFKGSRFMKMETLFDQLFDQLFD